MNMIKTIGASGQITLGKEYSGRTVVVEELEPGVWMVKLGKFIPDNEPGVDAMRAKTPGQVPKEQELSHPINMNPEYQTSGCSGLSQNFSGESYVQDFKKMLESCFEPTPSLSTTLGSGSTQPLGKAPDKDPENPPKKKHIKGSLV